MSEAPQRLLKLEEAMSETDSEGSLNSLDTSLIHDLLKKEHVLIIGSEAILKKNAPKTQGTGDSLIRVYNAIADQNNIAEDQRPKTEQEWQKLFSERGYNRQSCIAAWDYIWKNEKNTITKYVEDNLYDLIETKLFPIVLTTCIDPIIEIIMKAVWGDVQVFNFNRKDNLSGTLQEFIKMRNDHQREHAPLKPSLVYLFGKIGDKTGLNNSVHFVFDEYDAIDCIANFVKKTTDNDDHFFSDYLFSNRIMSIGCRFDDWRFRFFWYAIRGSQDRIKNGTVAYTCTQASDPLLDYLERNEVHTEEDSRAFMGRLVRLLTNKENYQLLLQKRTKNAQSIFISYASEDFHEAYQLFSALTDKSFNVWLDSEDLHQNDNYENEIEKAIKECGVFLPILSNQVKKDLVNKETNRYYFKEWQFALMDGKTIVPIIIEGYDYKQDYHLLARKKLGFDLNDITIQHFYIENERKDIITKLHSIIQKL